MPVLACEHLKIVKRNTDRLRLLIDQLLELARLDAGKLTLNLEALDLCQFVRWIAASYESVALRQGKKLLLDVPEPPLPCQVDPAKLETVLGNLLSNALKFTQAGGRIALRVRAEESEILLVVQDTGCGIPADKISVIFNRFSQADTSATRKYEGTGIGLSLSKELVELHGGRIEVSSREGFGAEFLPSGSRSVVPRWNSSHLDPSRWHLLSRARTV